MLRTIIAASLAAVGAPVLAQTADTDGMTPPTAADPAIVVENSPERAKLADKARADDCRHQE